jgi:hypothetical protein
VLCDAKYFNATEFKIVNEDRLVVIILYGTDCLKISYPAGLVIQRSSRVTSLAVRYSDIDAVSLMPMCTSF